MAVTVDDDSMILHHPGTTPYFVRMHSLRKLPTANTLEYEPADLTLARVEYELSMHNS